MAELSIENPPYLQDHRAEGRAILPAVLSLELLAQAAAAHLPNGTARCVREAAFLRFLELPPDGAPIAAEIEVHPRAPDAVLAELVARKEAGRAGLRRTSVIVRATYGAPPALAPPPVDILAGLEGIAYRLESEELYAALIPFGPAFQNVLGRLHLSPDGAVGWIRAASHPAPKDVLGNPFVLDAAFHLACAWGQRYTGRLFFPTGFSARAVERPCETGGLYFCRLFPRDALADGGHLFDLWLFDAAGALREVTQGVRMQDVAQGRMAACPGVRDDGRDPLSDLRTVCRGLTVIELGAMPPFASVCFSAAEETRAAGMGTRRLRAYTGARLALKRLWRALGGDSSKPAKAIETLAEDPRPRLSDLAIRCAASHDDRFAVAAAADRPVGVDVERLSDRLLRTLHFFASPAEQGLVRHSSLGPEAAAARVWTLKEAAAKALSAPLPAVFGRLEVQHLEERRATGLLDGRPVEGHSAEVDGHVFGLLVL